MVWPMSDSDVRLDHLARLIGTVRRTAWLGGDDAGLRERCYAELKDLARVGTPLERALAATVVQPGDLPDNPPMGKG